MVTRCSGLCCGGNEWLESVVCLCWVGQISVVLVSRLQIEVCGGNVGHALRIFWYMYISSNML